MKLLLDENVSDRIVQRIADLFPDSMHVKFIGLKEADDSVVWDWARQHGYSIVSKGYGFLPESYCIRRSAQVHLAARRQLLDGSDRESFEIAL